MHISGYLLLFALSNGRKLKMF